MKILLILLFFIKLSYSSIINFNNSVINSCTKTTPCSLKTNQVWVNGNIPTDGDDIVIDFSTLKATSSQSIYLVGNGLEIELSSFYLDGASNNGYNTELIIQDSNLIINGENSGYFKVLNANVTLIESKESSNHQIQINNLISNQVNLVVDGYANVQTVNLTITSAGPNVQTIIQGNSVLNATQWANITSPIYHTSNELLAFTGNGFISDSFISTGTVQIHNITVNSNTTINTLFLDAFMIITPSPIKVSVITLQFNYIRHAIYIGMSSSLEINGTINGQASLDGINIIVLGYLLLPSGYSISNIVPTSNGLLMNGKIIIKDSTKTTLLTQINEKYLDIQTPGNLIINNSTLGTVTLSSFSSTLDVQSNSTISYLECAGTTTVEALVSLILKYEASCNIMNVGGYLSTQAFYSGTTLNVLKGGYLYSHGYVQAYVISNSVTQFSSFQQTQSINIQTLGSLSLDYPGLAVDGNLTFASSTELKLHFLAYNGKPAITVNGEVSISSLNSLYIEMQYLESAPQNNDRIYLINTNDTSNITIDDKVISFSNFDSSPFNNKLEYTIEKDKHNVYIQFKRNNTVLIAVLCTVIPIVLIAAVVLVIVLKRRSQSNSFERTPLKGQL